MKIPIGVANSISKNFNYDPRDTLHYVKNEGFECLQIYLSNELLQHTDWYPELEENFSSELSVVFHAEGDLNRTFFSSSYYQLLQHFFTHSSDPHYILHFDEQIQVDHLVDLIEKQVPKNEIVYLENYFKSPGPVAAVKNIKKFMALFTLVLADQKKLLPVLDIPRFFHANLQWSPSEALNWIFQLMNFFSLRRIPVLLHLVDYSDPRQQRNQFCPVGEGYIPYSDFFKFVIKTEPLISGIILEYEDKLNPLKSRQNILRMMHSG